MKSTVPSQPQDLELDMSARPTSLGRFGRYGGQYVPETLIPALAELEKAAAEAWKDKSFTEELSQLLKTYVGRETPLYEAKRLSKHYQNKTHQKGRIILVQRPINNS